MKKIVCSLLLLSSLAFANPNSAEEAKAILESNTLEVQALVKVADKAFGKIYYRDITCPNPLLGDLRFLKYIDEHRGEVRYLGPYSYWVQVIAELDGLRVAAQLEAEK